MVIVLQCSRRNKIEPYIKVPFVLLTCAYPTGVFASQLRDPPSPQYSHCCTQIDLYRTITNSQHK